MVQTITLAEDVQDKPTKNESVRQQIVVSTDGTRMSAMNDTALALLGAGSVIEVEVEVKGKYTNIKSWKPVSQTAIVKPEIPMSKDDWTDKQTLERQSIEGSVAYKALTDALINRLWADEDQREWLLLWEDRTKAMLASFPAQIKDYKPGTRHGVEASMGKVTEGQGVMPIPIVDVADLLKRCSALGVDGKGVFEIAEVKTSTELGKLNLNEVFELVVEAVDKGEK